MRQQAGNARAVCRVRHGGYTGPYLRLYVALEGLWRRVGDDSEGGADVHRVGPPRYMLGQPEVRHLVHGVGNTQALGRAGEEKGRGTQGYASCGCCQQVGAGSALRSMQHEEDRCTRPCPRRSISGTRAPPHSPTNPTVSRLTLFVRDTGSSPLPPIRAAGAAASHPRLPSPLALWRVPLPRWTSALPRRPLAWSRSSRSAAR